MSSLLTCTNCGTPVQPPDPASGPSAVIVKTAQEALAQAIDAIKKREAKTP